MFIALAVPAMSFFASVGYHQFGWRLPDVQAKVSENPVEIQQDRLTKAQQDLVDADAKRTAALQTIKEVEDELEVLKEKNRADELGNE
jgi:hypothetical protein